MKTLAELLESRVKIGSPNACWPWIGAVNKWGYGNLQMCRHGKNIQQRAHRVAWIIANKRDVPDGQVVMHTCNNPRCCNPQHLVAGTQKENMEYMDECGNRVDNSGEKNGHAKLTWDDVRLIRRLYPQGRTTMLSLAAWFNVSDDTISQILTRKAWREK